MGDDPLSADTYRTYSLRQDQTEHVVTSTTGKRIVPFEKSSGDADVDARIDALQRSRQVAVVERVAGVARDLDDGQIRHRRAVDGAVGRSGESSADPH